MKKTFVAISCFFVLVTNAQKTTTAKPVTKTINKTVPQKTSAQILKNQSDSISYAIGLSVANFYKQQGVILNIACVQQALNDVLSNKKTLLTEDQANLIFMCHSNPQLCTYVKEGEKFLAENKKKPNITTTASGLQYEIITQGTGAKPVATDTVVAHYAGTLINGTEFDNSYKRGAPLSIPLNQVIKGWTEGMQLMPVGSKYKFYIPYQLGYGLNDAQVIPGGSVLIFEVELLDIKKAK